MSETREFPTRVIASLSSGVLLCDFSKMHEAAEYLMGHPIWTHQFADKDLWREMQQAIAQQCPGMPMDLSVVTKDNFEHIAQKLEEEIGITVTIRKGSGLTARLPTDGIPGHAKIITVRP